MGDKIENATHRLWDAQRRAADLEEMIRFRAENAGTSVVGTEAAARYALESDKDDYRALLRQVVQTCDELREAAAFTLDNLEGIVAAGTPFPKH